MILALYKSTYLLTYCVAKSAVMLFSSHNADDANHARKRPQTQTDISRLVLLVRRCVYRPNRHSTLASPHSYQFSGVFRGGAYAYPLSNDVHTDSHENWRGADSMPKCTTECTKLHIKFSGGSKSSSTDGSASRPPGREEWKRTEWERRKRKGMKGRKGGNWRGNGNGKEWRGRDRICTLTKFWTLHSISYIANALSALPWARTTINRHGALHSTTLQSVTITTM